MGTNHRLWNVWAPTRVVVILVFIAFATGCGPIEYINQVTRKASSEVEAAKAVKADKFAPYWYTRAVEYLHKAREEAAHADYQAANRFGRRAEESARKARELSIKRASDPSTMPKAPTLVEGEDELEIVDPTSEEATTDADDNPLDIDMDSKEN